MTKEELVMNNLSAKPSRLGPRTARFILILATVALFQIAANAQTSAEQQCFDLIQGKVAHDKQGNTNWGEFILRKVCLGTSAPQATADCFKKQITAGEHWTTASQTCEAIQTPESQCFHLVQNKVAYDSSGSTSWSEQNIVNLCRGTRNATATVNCFKSRIAGGIGWQKATAECTGDMPRAVLTQEEQCPGMIQGKVAYDKVGNANWTEGNLAELCRGTTDAQATINCFSTKISAGVAWSEALDACKIKTASERKSSASSASGKPVNQMTWLGMHNAISSYAYGYISQNSQRYDVTTQLNGGARMLEIDIVWDTPDDKQEAGVYVCHCGEAPHSYSASEMKRARDKPMKSLLPLPAWSSGATYTRFSTILMEIDKWLAANPNEIVFIMLENHKVFQNPFDKEVERAALKTGTYIKPKGKEWATKSQLITAKQRLIILAHDGGEILQGSKYANEKAVTKWGGDLQPEIYGVQNTYEGGKRAGDSNAIIAVGSFATGATDAITARYFNEYSHFSRRKAEWVSKGYDRFPTFIQVNQIQIGDALRFVNELNGPENQIVGTVPKDPFGNWIVNASADVGQAFADLPGAVVDTGDAIVNLFGGGKYIDTTTSVPKKPMPYVINVKTSDISDAGTDSAIYLRIYGLSGKTDNIYLNDKIKENAFEQGETNTLGLVAEDVGIITYIEVESSLSGTGAGWHPEYIEITVGGRTTKIMINGWIDSDRRKARIFFR